MTYKRLTRPDTCLILNNGSTFNPQATFVSSDGSRLQFMTDDRQFVVLRRAGARWAPTPWVPKSVYAAVASDAALMERK